jgi:hypothetical protein
MNENLKYWDVDDAYLDHECNEGISNLGLRVEDCLCLIWSCSLRTLSSD